MSELRAAVLVPGAWGGQATSSMTFSSVAVKARGAATYPVTWEPPDSIYARPDTVLYWVREHVEPVLDRVDPQASIVIIGKSLGSNAANVAADRGLPAIWLTPLLSVDRVRMHLRRATAPFLLIGGTADRSWDGAVARELTEHVCEIDGADHGFFRPSLPLVHSADVLAQMATAVEAFLDEVVWPVAKT